MVRCRVSTGTYTRADTCGRRIGGQVKKTTKAPPAPTKVDTIILHIYALMGLGPGGRGFSPQDFIDWFKALDDPSNPVSDKWSVEGINVEFYTNTKSGVKDFEKSLQRKGAIVVYIGHSTLDKGNRYHSLGLDLSGIAKQPEIPSATLRTLLSKSAASLVIIASCDAKTAVGKLSAGPPVIVQNSGTDTNSKTDTTTPIPRMANAVATFLFLLIGWERDRRGQPNDPHKGATRRSTRRWLRRGMDDRFELIQGDGSIKLFP
jgi:hypothetical protein